MGRGLQPNYRVAEELSNDQSIDGLLWGTAWGNLTNHLTFSFPQSPLLYIDYPDIEVPQNYDFSPAALWQEQTIRFATSLAAEYTQLNFREITETFEETGTIRFANSTLFPEIAWAYSPFFDDTGGDMWADLKDYQFPRPGDYAFMSFLHEFGHAIGLKHGNEAEGHASFHPGPLPPQEDHWSYSLMTYRAYEGEPLGEGPAERYSYENNPYTFMQNDIAALQYLYGANFRTREENTVYKWDPDTGALFINGVIRTIDKHNNLKPKFGIIFETVWDGNGNDTYDLSSFKSDMTVNLEPGAFSIFNESKLADLDETNPGAHRALGNIANARLFQDDLRSLIENVIGGSGNDEIKGNTAANVLKGGAGDDTLDGGEGSDELVGGAGDDTLYGDLNDHAVFSGKRSDYLLRDDGKARIIVDKVMGRDGTDTLKGQMFGKFSDGTVILGTEVKDEKIHLDEAMFEALGSGSKLRSGSLDEAFFTIGREARDENDYIVYDDLSGDLFYDPDGFGAGKAIEIVLSRKDLKITADSFIIG